MAGQFAGKDGDLAGAFYIGENGRQKEPTTPEYAPRKSISVAVEDMHPLFCELEMLERSPKDGELYWKETARWVKFEESLEEAAGRWSKPHVASLSYVDIAALMAALEKGSFLSDVSVNSIHELAVVISNELRDKGVPDDQISIVREIFVTRHKHKMERRSSLANFRKSRRGSIQRTASKKGMPSDANMNRGETATSLSDSDHTDDSPFKRNVSFMRHLPKTALAANILVGTLENLNEPVTMFMRLSEPSMLGELTEVSIPTKFVFLHLTPGTDTKQNKGLGRCMGALLADGQFRGTAYRALNKQDFITGIGRFLDDSVILPPGEWDPKIRLEPPSKIPERAPPPEEIPEKEPLLAYPPVEEEEDEHASDPGLERTGRLFGGFIQDIKRKWKYYPSDFKDALHIQCFASTIFIYIACLTPIITFGGLLGKATKNKMAAMEGILAGALCGTTYALFAGQPLTIVGSTGPMLVFESILFKFCEDRSWDFLSFRIWVGLWCTVFLLLMVMFDLSFLVKYITRFTEEGFASLISIIFIYEAIEKVLHLEHDYGVNRHARDPESHICHCSLPPYVPPTPGNVTGNLTTSAYNMATTTVATLVGNMSNVTEELRWQPNSTFLIGYWERKKCLKLEGELIGEGCHYVSNVFLFSFLIFLGTFVVSYGLKMFKTSPFFPSKVREIVSDFAVVIAVILMTLTDMLTGLDTPKLQVPEKFQPTREDRGWFIPLFGAHGENPWWLTLMAAVPAALAVVLIFLDQQITAVIINRKENKLKKGAGYHLDLFVIAIQIGVCSLLGLPWFVAATVRAMTHVMSLRKESEASAPGEKPEFLGTREQRVTNFLVSLLIGLSVPLTVIFKRIPMPVLYGVFLFMGISSLKGLQFIDRILLVLMPEKYQPDYSYLRVVRTWRVHVFTLIQIICMVGLWVFKVTKSIAIAFPLLVLAMCFVRKGMEWIFTNRELKALDHVLPQKEPKKAKGEKGKELQTITNGSELRHRKNKDGMV